MGDQDRKKIILILRWAAILITSYLILFGRGRVTHIPLSYTLIAGYFLSNVLLTLLPKEWFSNQKLFNPLIIFDTGMISFGMFLSEKMTTDFYPVFFLIILSASIRRNFKRLIILGGVSALIYGFLLYHWGLLTSENNENYILRVPFIFIITAFYGHILQTLTKEKHHELTISENKYQDLFENANDGIIILSYPQMQIVDVNREVVKTMGYSKENLLHREIFDFFAFEEIENARSYFKEARERGEERADHLSFKKKDHSLMKIDLSTKRIDLGKESFYQVIFRDLTEQRKLEKKIRESKRHLEAIFDGIGDKVSIQNLDYEILRVNRAVIERYHTTFLEVLGKKCYEVYHQRDLPCENCPMAVTIETKQPTFSIQKSPDGETVNQIFSYPIFDEKGDLLSVIEYARDITKEQKLQDQLIQSEKLAGIGALASGMAHEINNPVSGIIGMAEVALEEEEISNIRNYLNDILICAKRIDGIVTGLRSYSRAAKREELSPVDLNEVLEESLKMVRMAIKTKKVEVIREFQPMERIEAKKNEIQQIFTNLVTNAFQAMDGKKGKLILSTCPLRDSVEVKVNDNGTGIPQKYLNQIFDPFFTTKKPSEGTGLGLNIVYRIITKYEGTIDVESKEQVGTTFTIRFPKRRGHP